MRNKPKIRYAPVARGLALIAARNLFGPSAHVQVRGYDCCILDQVGGALLGSGRSWEQALSDTRKKAA